MKRAWDPVVLTVNFWHGPDPDVGDTLRTKTGRQYLIQRFRLSKPDSRGRTRIRALECVVLPKDEPVPGRVHEWTWSPRTKRGRR